MKRAWLSLAAFFGLVLIAARANGVCPTITVNNNLPDTVKVGFGGTLELSASWISEEMPVDSCGVATIAWAKLSPGAPASLPATGASPVDLPDSGVAYTGNYRFPDPATYRIVPYVVDSLSVLHYSLDTTVVIVKEGLWYPDAFHYRGCFRVQDNDGTGGDSYFSYKGGSMMAYCPDGEAGDSDGYDGSLFMNGYMTEGFGPNFGGEIAQMTIPAPVISDLRTLGDLNTAQYIQNFAPAFGPSGWNTSWISYAGQVPKGGDLFYIPASGGLPRNTLYFTFRDTYAVDADYYSLGRIPSDLSDFSPLGLWHLGTLNSSATNPYNFRSWASYLFAAPPDWRSNYLGGKWLIAGMGDREAGTNGGSRGPTLYAFDPLFQDRGGTNSTGSAGGDTSKIPVLRLLQYQPNGGTGGDTSCDSTYGTQRAYYEARRGYDRENDYSLTDAWHGGSWIWHNNRQSLVFSVTKCRYHSHYYQPGTLECGGYPCAGIDDGSGWTCGDATSTPPAYRTALWFYDPDDILAVLQGSKEVYEPQPYASLSLTEFQWDPTECTASFRDMAYDETNGRLYISEPEADGPGTNKRPLIHVFDITPWESFVASMSITAQGYNHAGDSLQVIFDWDLQTTADCTFATDTTSVASISIVVADSVYVTDTAPLALPPFETKVYLATAIPAIVEIKGRINIDASGTDCDGQFDSNVRSVYVVP